MKVWKVNDCDWVAAETAEEAREFWSNFTGNPMSDLEDCITKEVTDAQMKTFIFTSDDYPSKERTFERELKRRIDDGEKFPQFFASTEW